MTTSGIAVPFRQSDDDKAERKKAIAALEKAKELMANLDLVEVKTQLGKIYVERHIYEANKEKYDKLSTEIKTIVW